MILIRAENRRKLSFYKVKIDNIPYIVVNRSFSWTTKDKASACRRSSYFRS